MLNGMSKQGVQLTQEHRKPRRRIKLEERDGVVGKECRKCGEWKPLDEYSRQESGLGSRKARCKTCINNDRSKTHHAKLENIQGAVGKLCRSCKTWKRLSDYHNTKGGLGGKASRCRSCVNKTDAPKNKVIKKDGTLGKNCSKCNIWKPLKQYYKGQGVFDGRRSECKSCEDESRRKYRIENADVIYERVKGWRKINPEKVKAQVHRRISREEHLPSNLSAHIYIETLQAFGYRCAISESGYKTELEHAIPISIGHGGTVLGNCYPLAKFYNQSKSDNNMFEWFEANRQRFELSQSKFDRLIEWLASANALTVQEYREFYDWCFANPRTVDEIKADQRHSIAIWREASGRQFPIPAYTETYYSSEVTEKAV